MSFVPSLLQAIVRVDGEALVMHVGEKPYVVSPSGQIDLAARGLSLDALTGIIGQLIPAESLRALDEFGAVQYALPPMPEFPFDHFTVVAARGGDDVWIEIRRRRIPDEDRVPPELFGPAAAAGQQIDDQLSVDIDERPVLAPAPPFVGQPPATGPQPPVSAQAPSVGQQPTVSREALPPAQVRSAPPVPPPPRAAPLPPTAHVPLPAVAAAPIGQSPLPPPAPVARPPAPPSAFTWQEQPAPAPSPAQPAVVLPLARTPIRPDIPSRLDDQPLSSLDRLLRLAAARGAATLYLSSAARPTIRADGEIEALDGAPVFGPNEVESLLLTLMPERNAEALRTGLASEWICDVPDVGRVRCMSFRDHRGPGGVFRMLPARAVSAEQLALSREIQSLAIEPEGLLLIAGPRSSGKRTLISAFVDLINRARRDHVITIEREINVVHERSGSLISQREVHSSDEVVAVARAALREDPDVLVVEELRTAAVMTVALDAAASGQLVIGGFPAPNASGAIDRIIDLYPSEYRRQVQISLAQNLRGVVAQVLLRKRGGGRVAAREVLLNTPTVRSILAEGRTSQLPLAIEGGRAHGMTPLNDALVGFVQSGAVDVREAFRRAGDRAGFLALLKRQGLDTSALERYA